MVRYLQKILLGTSLCWACVVSADEQDVSRLVVTLKDQDARRSARAAESLGHLGSKAKAAVPALIDALSDKRVTEGSTFPSPAPSPTVSSSASEALTEIGEPAVGALIDTLDSKNSQIRQLAIEILSNIGKPAKSAAPALHRVSLNDSFWKVRCAAIKALPCIDSGEPDLVKVLIVALRDPSSDVRGTAAQSLGKLGAKASTAVPDLIRALADHGRRKVSVTADVSFETTVYSNAIESLGLIGKPAASALPHLNELMKNKNHTITRIEAALAICRIDNDHDDELNFLIATLRQDNEGIGVPEMAAYALGQLGKKAKRALPELTKTLNHEDDGIRLGSVEAIAAVGGEEAVGILIPALQDDNVIVRMTVAEELGKFGPKALAAVPALIVALHDDRDYISSYVRRAAAEALGKIGPTAAVSIPALCKAFEDEDVDVRKAAVEATKRIQPPIKEELGGRGNLVPELEQ